MSIIGQVASGRSKEKGRKEERIDRAWERTSRYVIPCTLIYLSRRRCASMFCALCDLMGNNATMIRAIIPLLYALGPAARSEQKDNGDLVAAAAAAPLTLVPSNRRGRSDSGIALRVLPAHVTPRHRHCKIDRRRSRAIPSALPRSARFRRAECFNVTLYKSPRSAERTLGG